MNTNSVKILSQDDLEQIVRLTKQLNPDMSISKLENRQTKMFKFDTYRCFGFFKNDKLIGVSSGWITIRLYSDEQLEIDNVIIDNSFQSKGYGKLFMSEIELWAKKNNCKTIELNTH